MNSMDILIAELLSYMAREAKWFRLLEEIPAI